MKNTYKYSFLLLVLFLFQGCINADIDLDNISQEISVNPSLVVPLGGVRITMGYFLANEATGTSFFTDGNEVYYSATDSMEWKFGNIDLLKNIRPLITNYAISSHPIILPANTTLPTITTTDSLKFGLNTFPQNERVDSILVQRTVLSVIINKTGVDFSPNNVRIKLIFPKNQVRFLNPNQSNVYELRPTAFGQAMELSLENLMIKLPNLGSSLPIGIEIDATSGNAPISIAGNSYFQTLINFQSMQYAVAYGRFMPRELMNINLEYPLQLFENKRFGDFNYLFENPQVYITSTINFGAHLRFNYNQIKSFSSTNPSLPPIYAVFDGTDSPHEVFEEKPRFPGQTVVKNFRTLDNKWGHIDQLLLSSNQTDRLHFNLSLGLDSVLTKNDPTPDFITPDASLKLRIQKKLPLHLKAGSYYEHKDSINNVSSTIGAALDEAEKYRVNTAALVLNVTNGLPLNVKLKLQYIDSMGIEIKSDLKNEFVIASGKVNDDGIVQPESVTKKMIVISISKDQIPIARRIKKIMSTERIDGENASSKIYILDNNSFELRLGVFVNVHVKN